MKTNRIQFESNPTDAVAEARAEIEREFPALNGLQPRLLRLILNEAEALAWETEFPHLVFPALATEKIEALETWSRRQNAIRRTNPSLAFAA